MKQEMKKKPKLLDNRDFVGESVRIPPQAQELEAAVLGSLLQEEKAYALIENILQPEMFYNEAHGIIFAAIAGLHNERRPADILTVIESLKQSGKLEMVGGAVFIAGLTSKVAGSFHIEHHARIISQKHLSRSLIALSAEIQSRAFDETEDVSETMEFLETRFTEISTSRSASESIEMGEAVHRALEKAAKIQQERESGKSAAIHTGINALTREFYGGWKAPDLIVLAARPSMGKTGLAVHFAKSAAEADKEVLFVSIEMTDTQLVNRILLEDDRISAYNLSTGQMSSEEWKALDSKAGELWNLKIHIAAEPGIRYLDAICSEARRLKRKGKLDMVIIDYLGLILIRSQKFERRQLEIARITGTLKSLAKELDVPVMLLSQLNRPEKSGTIREPQLHDLRESGDIEQDADIVLFIHRPTYYDRDKYPEWEGYGKIIIGKYREGARNNSVVFAHDSNFKKFWGDEGAAKRFSGNFQPVDFSAPAEVDDLPF
jgi:replicative DNA helicase